MLDIKHIVENPEAFDKHMINRNVLPCAGRLIALDEVRRKIITDIEVARRDRNELSKAVGQAKSSGDEAKSQNLMEEVGALKKRIQQGEIELRTVSDEFDGLLAGLPNIPLEDVPVGEDEEANVLYRRSGEPDRLNITPRQHFELGEALGLMDFEAAARLSGARFVVLRGALARMERALAGFMLDIHTNEFGYEEVSPPLLVREASMFGTGQLPKFRDDQFHTEDDFWLLPTAEVALTNLVRETIIAEEALPLRYTAATPCFRKEAGAAGRDTRGMIRQHQFTKVELVSITTPDMSLEELERMLSCAEQVLKRLGLPYRVMILSTGDMGFSACKTYDVEVWMPGQGVFREISSCSLCGDFQARRMQARYRKQGEKALAHVHTLNGSGLAIGRTMAAILENNQCEDGSIAIPTALQPYMDNKKVIKPV
ncbi:MAG: serine--tRNA ligase [Parvularculales bacterium]